MGTDYSPTETPVDDEKHKAIQEHLESAKRAGWLMRLKISGTAAGGGAFGFLLGIVILYVSPASSVPSYIGGILIQPSLVLLLLSVLPTDKRAVKGLCGFLTFLVVAILGWLVMLFQFYYRLMRADQCRVSVDDDEDYPQYLWCVRMRRTRLTP